MKRTLVFILTVGLIGLASGIPFTHSEAWAAGSSGGVGFPTPAPSSRQRSPEQLAQQAYLSGLKHKEKAWKQEQKASGTTSDRKRDKYLERARREYVAAQEDFADALRADPRHAEAANEMGYALRQAGDYQKAIGAYNYALQIKPDFLEAVEYRAEALLALGFYDEVKDAYMTLFRGDPALAAQLMTAMEERATENPEPSADETTFAAWVTERRRISDLTGDIAPAGGAW